MVVAARVARVSSQSLRALLDGVIGRRADACGKFGVLGAQLVFDLGLGLTANGYPVQGLTGQEGRMAASNELPPQARFGGAAVRAGGSFPSRWPTGVGCDGRYAGQRSSMTR
jgi:hypothetical protein